jgi:hypothetical protein
MSYQPGDKVHVHFESRDGVTVHDFDGTVEQLGNLFIFVRRDKRTCDCYKAAELTLIERGTKQLVLF